VAEALSRGELLFVQGRGGWTVHTKQYLKDEKGEVRSSKAFSIIDDVYTQHGTNEIIEMFGDAQVFPFPKPTGLMKSLLRIGTSANEDDIVLDLFAGSCSSAQAVGELNRGDGGNRRSVSIQLPEPTGRKDFRTIADIGKERIRRVLAKLRSENAGQLTLPSPAQLEDLGFRVFKMAPSAFNPWGGGDAAEPEAYARQLELQTDPLVEGWKPQDVIWEVAVSEGFGLDAQVVPVAGFEALAVWRVTDPAREQSFVLCLADRIDLAALGVLNLGKEDLFICRDTALDDEAAANLALQCRLKTI
jgi:adenine-specific DNA-methyltransferase